MLRCSVCTTRLVEVEVEVEVDPMELELVEVELVEVELVELALATAALIVVVVEVEVAWGAETMLADRWDCASLFRKGPRRLSRRQPSWKPRGSSVGAGASVLPMLGRGVAKCATLFHRGLLPPLLP